MYIILKLDVIERYKLTKVRKKKESKKFEGVIYNLSF